MALKFLSNVSTSEAGTAAKLVNEASAALPSATLASMVAGETGSGSLVFATSPTLVTPNIGVATGTSLEVTNVLKVKSASGRDSLAIEGNTNGTNNRILTLTIASLTNSRIIIFPDVSGTVITDAPSSLTSAILRSMISDETGTGVAVFGTGPTISLPIIDNFKAGYSTTVTSASAVVLTASSNFRQFLTGSTAQTVTLPTASTMTLGMTFEIHNNSSATTTVNSSGGNLVATLGAGASCQITSILTSGTTAASWSMRYLGAVLG